MKKQLLLLMLMMLPLLASADAVEIDGIYYNLITKGNIAEVTKKPSNYSGNVVLPESVTYDDVNYRVKSIEGSAFYGCSGLTSVTISNSVTSIGHFAFSGCSSLTSVTIPNSVTSIGSYTFYGCSRLTSVTIPDSVTSIEDYTFYGCSSLTSITIPNSVTSIGRGAFFDCSSLTSITIPNSVTSIEERAFEDCRGLTSITIPNSVTSIGREAFFDCSGLTSVTISNSVTSIRDYAFQSCSSLTSVTIPNSVTSIGIGALSYCQKLTSITIGSGINNINSYAFAYCPELTDVTCLAEYVPSTNSNAFENSYIEYATLHVTDSAVNYYKAAEPWKNFKEILGINGTTLETLKCETPTISYQNGELTFSCATDGVEYIYEITDSDVKKGKTNKVKLTATYNISVYATKSGYDNSETATATLCWIDQQPKTEGVTNGIANIPAQAVLIQSEGGSIKVQGVDEGTQVNVYGINGTQAGSAISQSGAATINTNLQPGSIAIVKIGQKSTKIVMK